MPRKSKNKHLKQRSLRRAISSPAVITSSQKNSLVASENKKGLINGLRSIWKNRKRSNSTSNVRGGVPQQKKQGDQIFKKQEQENPKEKEKQTNKLTENFPHLVALAKKTHAAAESSLAGSNSGKEVTTETQTTSNRI